MRENFPLAVAAILIIFSFGIMILFVTAGLLENESTGEIKLQQIEGLIENATDIAQDTQNTTKYELKQIINKTSNALRNNQEIQNFQQLWEKPTNTTGED